jgi:hypothetical protein
MPVAIGMLLLLLFCDLSCYTREDIHPIKADHFAVQWFHTSSITSRHYHVEVKKKDDWHQVAQFDGNGSMPYDVIVNQDTVVVKVVKGTPVYQLDAYWWGIYVRLDSSITVRQYMLKYFPDQAQYY